MKKVSLVCGGKDPQIFCEDLRGEFGGYKQSANAKDKDKDKCFDSLLSYTNSKAVWFRLN